jgi:hypothetical protein
MRNGWTRVHGFYSVSCYYFSTHDITSHLEGTRTVTRTDLTAALPMWWLLYPKAVWRPKLLSSNESSSSSFGGLLTRTAFSSQNVKVYGESNGCMLTVSHDPFDGPGTPAETVSVASIGESKKTCCNVNDTAVSSTMLNHLF